MTPQEIAERIEAISGEMVRALENDGDPQYAAEAAIAALDSLAEDVRSPA